MHELTTIAVQAKFLVCGDVPQTMKMTATNILFLSSSCENLKMQKNKSALKWVCGVSDCKASVQRQESAKWPALLTKGAFGLN